MATATDTGTIVQSWVPVSLATDLKSRASSEGRSTSAEIRQAITEHLEYQPDRDEADAA